MQQYAGIYLLQVYSTCFGRPSRPSSGVQKTVTAASGTGHSNGAVNKYLYTVASCWILSIQSHDARSHEYKIVNGVLLFLAMGRLFCIWCSALRQVQSLNRMCSCG